MKIERTKNATRNIFFGMLLKIYQIFIPFLMRTAMTYFMGVEYLGLNSLFVSILHVLNLAELGVGSAMVYAMYKPIAEDDVNTVSALMVLYRRYYRIIGIVIAIVGLSTTPIIPFLVKGDIPSELNIYILFLLNLSATVLSYWLFAYKNCLLIAHQRSDVTSKITICLNTIQYALQFLALILWQNYYLYLIISILCQIGNNISTSFIVSRMYPLYKTVGNFPKEQIRVINSKIRDLFFAKIGGVVLNSADTIVISAFLGLRILAMYQNYYFIINAVYGLIDVILISITAGIGNSYITESKEKNYSDMKKFLFMFSAIINFCMCCFLGIFQPFMKIWMGEKLQLEYSVVICLCIYFYVWEKTRFLNIFKNAAGEWHRDRYRPLVSAVVNLSLNLLTVRALGVFGVILSSIIALGIIEVPWLFRNIFSVIYDQMLLKDYLKKDIKYVSITVMSCVLVSVLTRLLGHLKTNDWTNILICIGVCITIPNIMFWCLCHKQNEYVDSLLLVNRIVKRRRLKSDEIVGERIGFPNKT